MPKTFAYHARTLALIVLITFARVAGIPAKIVDIKAALNVFQINFTFPQSRILANHALHIVRLAMQTPA